MAGGGSKVAIYGAVIANTLIAISKFIAAGFTGSASMMAEGIHSLVDTSNGLLLLYGIRRSKRPADESHPFGYGLEVYFWSFIVAILIFALGGGIAIYEGIEATLHPAAEMHDPTWNYIVLGLAILFEGTALIFALRAFRKNNTGKYGLIQSVMRSKDSATVAIIMEDSAALIGLLIALVGITLAYQFNMPIIDGIASIFIGVLLSFVAIFLARQSKGLLLGESMSKEEIHRIRQILISKGEVADFSAPKTMHFGPESVLLAVDVEFKDHLETDEIERVVLELETEIKTTFPIIDKCFIETVGIDRGRKE